MKTTNSTSNFEDVSSFEKKNGYTKAKKGTNKALYIILLCLCILLIAVGSFCIFKAIEMDNKPEEIIPENVFYTI